MNKYQLVIGIDEVGRGALAGPVVVAATALAIRGWRLETGKPSGELRDSKKLSARQREAWFKYFKAHPKVEYALARVYPRQIEKRNISRAANLAAERAFLRLIKNCKLKAKNCAVFLDGGLYLGSKNKQIELCEWPVAKTIVRGDEKIKAIAAASIMAKVSRDKFMRRLAKKYPQYGFEVHKGYGTKKHVRAIKQYGSSKAHRLTFLDSSV